MSSSTVASSSMRNSHPWMWALNGGCSTEGRGTKCLIWRRGWTTQKETQWVSAVNRSEWTPMFYPGCWEWLSVSLKVTTQILQIQKPHQVVVCYVSLYVFSAWRKERLQHGCLRGRWGWCLCDPEQAAGFGRGGLHLYRSFRPFPRAASHSTPCYSWVSLWSDLSNQEHPQPALHSSPVSLCPEPPHVSLSEEKLVLKTESPQTLSCHCSKYYPLDAQVCELCCRWNIIAPLDAI